MFIHQPHAYVVRGSARGVQRVQTPLAGEPKKGKRKKEPPPDVVPLTQLDCRERLGGLLKDYYRKAA